VHRWLVLVALVGCDEPIADVAPQVRWLYPPAPSAWPLGVARGRIGRSIAPQPIATRPIVGAPDVPLTLPTPWTVPGDGPARAILSGFERGKPAVELVEIDAGRVVWRDTTICAGPVVAVTAEVVVCSDDKGTRSLGLDGKLRWRSAAPTLVATDTDILLATSPPVIKHANRGDERFIDLPAGFEPASIVATCIDAVFAVVDGKLSRFDPHAPGRPADPGPIQRTPLRPPPKHVPMWTIPIGTVAAIDACKPDVVDVTIASDAGTSVLALARDTGKVVGRVDGVHGFWPARVDPARLEIATSSGVTRYAPDLGANQPLALPGLGELLARRGERRLVRATPLTAVLLDRTGVRAFVPLGERGAVLGDDAILAASWLGAPGQTARLVAIPPRWQRPLRITQKHPPLAIPAELRDVPQPIPLDTGAAIALDAARFGVGAIALDPLEPAVYATTLEHAADATGHAGVARFDAATKTWRWHRGDACGTGAPIALAASRMVVACAARATNTASVRATGRDGGALWEWPAGNVDTIAAAADIVIAGDADRLVVLDAATGQPLGMLASSDGAAVRAAALDLSGMAMLVTYEQGRVVARLPRVAMLPAWSIAVDGVVRDIQAAGDGVVVALEDGDAFRIDARTGVPVALAGLDLAWRGAPDVVTGEAPGGPIPGRIVEPKLPPEVYHKIDLALAPAIATPWPPPPAMPASWELTLYELSGALRVRNDYPLVPPITPAARAWGAPFVVASGPLGHDLLVIDNTTGDPVRRVALPDDAGSGANVAAFATIVDGHPVVGTILAGPLRAVVF
jgi:hypothetical protein